MGYDPLINGVCWGEITHWSWPLILTSNGTSISGTYDSIPKTWIKKLVIEGGWSKFTTWTKKPKIRQSKKPVDQRNQFLKPTPLKFNIAPEKMVVGRLLSYWEGNFSGAMLNFWKICPRQIGSWNPKVRDETSKHIWVATEPSELIWAGWSNPDLENH